jgi:phosphohistidine phosphatase
MKKKHLLIMRHAKAERDPERWEDYDRPLNARGRRDAPAMGRWLQRQSFFVDEIFSSPALRTRETAERVAEQLEFKGTISLPKPLYEGSSKTYLAQIRLCPASARTLLIVGHNPALEELVELLSGEWLTLKTAAIAHLRFAENDWSAASSNSFELIDDWTPGDIKES